MAQLMDRDMSENLPKKEFKTEGSKKGLSCHNLWAKCLLKECK